MKVTLVFFLSQTCIYENSIKFMVKLKILFTFLLGLGEDAKTKSEKQISSELLSL